METITTMPAISLSAETLLSQWLGHRGLTRRVIAAFPEDKLFTHSVGGMRTFADILTELLTLGAPGILGVVNGGWENYQDVEASFKLKTKQEFLDSWDAGTKEIQTLWPKISQERFFETDKFFGLYEGPNFWSILYLIDNEMHDRAQGYVYLRSLGIEPPPFW